MNLDVDLVVKNTQGESRREICTYKCLCTISSGFGFNYKGKLVYTISVGNTIQLYSTYNALTHLLAHLLFTFGLPLQECLEMNWSETWSTPQTG